jgi:aspartyl-tRNA(Asn)/glutamyl-tRNA(Gln) amidotransferase subunit B
VLGLPGTLPVPNAEAIRLAVRLGLALGSEIDLASRFARKHYFYPDLPKGYQISQYEHPICRGGTVPADVQGAARTFRLTRIHLEEDAGKTSHDPRRGQSLVDYNRAGTPLVEIVGEPDLRSADEAVAYLKSLHQIVTWLGVCDGNMEAGNFRCDANVSVRRPGAPYGTRTEIKNVNSFRFVQLAIESELARQIDVLEHGGTIVQETRGWDETTGKTKSLRSKEDAHDYRYFPDPDLMTLRLDPALLLAERAALSELPAARKARFQTVLGLSPYDADVLTQSRARADYFENVCTYVQVMSPVDPKVAANWIINDLLGALAKSNVDLDVSPITPDALAELLALVQASTISSRMAKDALQAMLQTGVRAAAWVAEHGAQVSDADALAAIVNDVLTQHAPQVAEYLAGKTKVLGFLTGAAMKASRGKADPKQLGAIMKTTLDRLAAEKASP